MTCLAITNLRPNDLRQTNKAYMSCNRPEVLCTVNNNENMLSGGKKNFTNIGSVFWSIFIVLKTIWGECECIYFVSLKT
jgi:hypothetical protein